MKLDLSTIRIDGGTQLRVAINEAAVADYADAILAGASLPPIVVFFDGADYWMADGFHRYHGHRKVGRDTIDADLREGTRRDAVLYSLGANAAHGLRRTNDDKRRAVQTILDDEEWCWWTDRRIAEVCGVSNNFVGDMRRQLSSDDNSAPEKRVGADGKQYKARKAPKEEPDELDAALKEHKGVRLAPVVPGSRPEGEPEGFEEFEHEDLLSAMTDRVAELERENDTLRLAAAADVVAEIEKIKSYARTVEGQRDDYMRENAELKREVKRLQKRLGIHA